MFDREEFQKTLKSLKTQVQVKNNAAATTIEERKTLYERHKDHNDLYSKAVARECQIDISMYKSKIEAYQKILEGLQKLEEDELSKE